MLRRVAAALHRAAEGVAAALLAVVFVAFIVQIALRYLFNWPVGWTTEISLAAWLWLVLWGAAFVLRDEEEIRIEILANRGARRTRAIVGTLGAVGVVVLFGLSLPATYDYVSFMRVEKSAYLGVRMDVMYSIYVVFAVAVIARGLIRIVRLWRSGPPAVARRVPPDPAA